MERPKTGVDVVNEFRNLHFLAGGMKPKMSVEGMRHINTRFKRLKDVWHLESDDLKRMFAWMYCHNPLGFDDLKRYGSLEHLDAIAAAWVKWWKANRVQCATCGFRSTMYSTAPDQCAQEIDKALEEALHQLAG